MIYKRLHNPAALIAALLFLALVFAIAGAANSNSATIESAKSDRFALATQELCDSQTWPNISPACLSWQTDSAAPQGFVRTVTIEQRDETGRTSYLMRVPATDTANR